MSATARLRLASLASTALALALPALAQDPAAQPATAAAAVNLGSETVTVTATRTAKDVNDVPATVSVITEEEINNRLVNDIKDLIRYEPGVSVRRAPARFGLALGTAGRDGNSGFNIRGLEGNRVLIQVDGIRVADSYTFGAQSVGRGDFVDMDMLKRVEILRGPASALFGSDGLAGAVSFETKDPGDFLTGDRDWHVQATGAYQSADEGVAYSGIGAGRAGEWSAMVAYTHRTGEGMDNKGTNESANTTRTVPNPEDSKSDAVLAKLVFTPNDEHEFKLTYDRLDQHVDWNVLSARSVPPLTTTSVLNLTAFDDIERQRFSFDHHYEGTGFIRSAKTNLYYQDSTTRQFSFEDRNGAADRTRDATFDNRVWGIGTVLESGFTTGSVEHTLVYGFDYSVTRQESIRTGTVPPVGETFPARAFPTTDYSLLGIYVQDEIALMDGRLTLFPALRFDWYDLDPVKNDPLYTASIPAGSSDTHVSPKFGFVFKVTDEVSLFANYAQGFKAPAPSQVNNGFSNPVSNYRSIANPDLKPETSETFEAGVRFNNDFLSIGFTGFWGTYEDFIEQIQVGGAFTAANPAIYQFVNLGSVEISGVEARVSADFGDGFGGLASFSYTSGTNTSGVTDVPLDSVDPLKFVAGLTYRDPNGRFGGELSLVHSAAKEASEASCAATCFLPDSFTVFDATAWVAITDNVKLRAGVFNIGDEKYFYWNDIRGIARTSTTIDAYSQPGRNYSVSLTVSL